MDTWYVYLMPPIDDWAGGFDPAELAQVFGRELELFRYYADGTDEAAYRLAKKMSVLLENRRVRWRGVLHPYTLDPATGLRRGTGRAGIHAMDRRHLPCLGSWARDYDQLG